MSSPVVRPVQVFREHLTALEAAISVCLADPDHRPVHRLRTETRRVEALVLLLALIPGLPEHRKEAAAFLRALTRLRRAGGKVRDLDVHRRMLEEFATAEDTEAQTQDSGTDDPVSAKPAAHPASAPPSAAAQEAALLSASACDLRRHMGEQRDHAAADLQEVLKHRQVKTAKAAETLAELLRPEDDLAIPVPDLLRSAGAVLARGGLLKPEAIAGLNEKELHTVRKAAKAARYVAETLPEDPAAAAAGQRYEALQDAGGQWHDALEIARAARRYFGKGHELTAVYRARREEKLAAYRSVLASYAATLDRAQGRKTASPRKLSPKKPSLKKRTTRTAQA